MILIQKIEKYLTTHLTKHIIYILTIFFYVEGDINMLNLKK